eukprot:364987-Chlamydomonas_euryale.AAC.10
MMCHPCPASTSTKDKQLHAIALKPSLSRCQPSRPLVRRAQLKKFNQLGYQQSKLLSSADNVSSSPRVQVKYLTGCTFIKGAWPTHARTPLQHAWRRRTSAHMHVMTYTAPHARVNVCFHAHRTT